MSTSDFALQGITQPVKFSEKYFNLGQLSSIHRRLLSGFIGLYFDLLSQKLGLPHLLEYHILLTDSKPVRLKQCCLAPTKMQFLRKRIKQLLDVEVIEPSSSLYASTKFLVPKPDQTYRAVVVLVLLMSASRLNLCQ
jgi:hypothetical protein